MGLVYVAKAPVVVPDTVPDGWPPDWPPFVPPSGDTIITPGDTPSEIPSWPPGWPYDWTPEYPDLNTDIVCDDIFAGIPIAVSSYVYDGALPTGLLEYHPMALAAYDPAGNVVRIRLSEEDEWSNSLWFYIQNIDGDNYGIDETVFFEVDPDDDGFNVSVETFVFSVDPLLEASIDVPVHALENFATVTISGSSSVTGSTTTVNTISVSVTGTCAVTATIGVTQTLALADYSERRRLDAPFGTEVNYYGQITNICGYVWDVYSGDAVSRRRFAMKFTIPMGSADYPIASLKLKLTSHSYIRYFDETTIVGNTLIYTYDATYPFLHLYEGTPAENKVQYDGASVYCGTITTVDTGVADYELSLGLLKNRGDTVMLMAVYSPEYYDTFTGFDISHINAELIVN